MDRGVPAEKTLTEIRQADPLDAKLAHSAMLSIAGVREAASARPGRPFFLVVENGSAAHASTKRSGARSGAAALPAFIAFSSLSSKR